ncbi:MAG: hypothetical protein ACI9VR_005128 [Cognaticolwellia sp.]|jgi:hypothetical protein
MESAMLRPFLLPTLLFGLSACAPTPVSFVCLEDDPLCSLEEALQDLPPAVSVDIEHVAFYQVTEKMLLQDGSDVSDDGVSVAQGRDAVLRVFLSPTDTYEERDLSVRVYLYQGDALVDAVIVTQNFKKEGSFSDLGSSFNLPIRGSAIGPDMGIAVEVLEATNDADHPGIQGRNAWPEDSAFSVDTVVTGPLKIVMVPIEYNADNSGRLPNTEEDEMERFRQAFYGQYPADEVLIRIADPQGTDIGIRNGWSALLGEVTGMRAAVGAEDDEYVYGLFSPGDDATGGTAGLCWVGYGPSDPGTKVCIGLSGSPSTAVHELGHSHGREHSPGCGAAGADPEYPESDGTLGVRAFDTTGNRIFEAATTYDFMSYCGPTWTGAHTWEKLVERVGAVNSIYGAYMQSAEYLTFVQDEHGNTTSLGQQWISGEPAGLAVRVELIGSDGSVLANVVARRIPMDHADGAMFRVIPPFGDTVVADIREVAWR